MSDFLVSRVEAPSLYELRRRILRGNDATANVAHPLDDDAMSRHFGGFLDGRLVVSASFFPSAPLAERDVITYQLRFMAADTEVQGKGYGARVLAEAERVLVALGARQLWANARDTALGFYRSTGWTVVAGSEFISDETQLPHTLILKAIDADNSMSPN